MTASAPRATQSLVPSAGDVRISTARREAHFAKETISWTRQPRLRPISLHLVSGTQPSTFICRAAHKAGDALVCLPQPFSAVTDLRSDGDWGDCRMPLGLRWYDLVKIEVANDAADANGSCLFVGYLVEWAEHLGPDGDGVDLKFLDAFHLLARAHVFGGMLYDEYAGTYTNGWLKGYLPIFNPKGVPNKVQKVIGEAPNQQYYTYHAFVEPGGTRKTNGSTYTPVDFKRGDAWNYLRRWHCVDAQEGLLDLSRFLTWPEVAPVGFGHELFTEENLNDETNSAIFQELNAGGDTVADALGLIVQKRGDLDLGRRYSGTTGKCRIDLYGTGSTTMSSDQRRINFRRGELGADVSAGGQEVAGGVLKQSAEATVMDLYGFGARKKFDLTISTPAAPKGNEALVKNWTDAEQALYVALADDDEKSKEYPNVFTSWILSRSARMSSLFGWALDFCKRHHGERELLSTIYTDGNIRVKMIVWRSTDGGTTWERCPAELHPSFPKDNVGLQFPIGAREEREWVPGDGADYYTWDGNTGAPTINDFRVTLCVEAEERLVAEISRPADESTGWPRLQRVIADDHYEYHARREALIHTDDGAATGNIVEEPGVGGGAALFGDGLDDAIRNDESKLEDALLKLYSQFSRPAYTGSLVVKGIRGDIRVGDFVGKLIGGGSAGLRPDREIDQPIAEIGYKFGERPETTITLSEA